MKRQVEISNNSIIKFWMAPVLIVATAAIIYFTREALMLVFLAMFLAVALNPIVDKLSSKFFNKKRTLATSITYLGILLILILVGLLIVPSITRQTSNFASGLPGLVSKGISDLKTNHFIVQNNLEGNVDDVLEMANKSLISFTDNINASLFTRVGSFLTAIFSIFIVLSLSFLMLIEGPEIMKSFWSFYDSEDMRNQHKRISGKFYNIVTSYVGGQLTVAFLNGILASIVVLILSLVFPISINLMAPVGILIMVFGLIPMVGATLGTIFAGFILLLSSLPAAIIFILYYVIYQQIENNIIIPYVHSKSLDLSVLIVLISVTVGLYLFGLLGGIISIPFAACVKVLFEENFSSRSN